MVPDQRNTFNQHFSEHKYAHLLSELNKDFEIIIKKAFEQVQNGEVDRSI
jgi:hypothetical protein